MTPHAGAPLAAMAVLLLAGCSSSSAVRTPTATASSSMSKQGGTATPCVQSWQLTSVLVPSGDDPKMTQLAAVAAITPDDVWAVGSTSRTGEGQPTETLVEHWDGTSWSIVPAPDVGNLTAAGGDRLTAISAASSDDIWAVGYVGSPVIGWNPSYPGAGPEVSVQTLTEHWNGNAWSIVNAPDVADLDGLSGWDELTGVVAISSDNAWAVGATLWPLAEDNGYAVVAQPLIEHWNGQAWSISASVDPEAVPPAWALASPTYVSPPANAPAVGSSALGGVTARSATDVWVVGEYDVGILSYPPSPWETLTEHWDGTRWTVVQAPDATLPEPVNETRAANDELMAAGTSSDGDLWAVGGALPESALTLRLESGAWQLVAAPALSATYYAYGSYEIAGSDFLPGITPLAAIAVLGPSDAWAVGAVILQWAGSSWQPLYTLDGRMFDYLTGVAATTSGGLWAVGGLSIVHGRCA